MTEPLSIEEGLRVAVNQLVLILSAAQLDEGDLGLSLCMTQEAIFGAAEQALEALEPLRQAPAGILNWVPGEPDPTALSKRKAARS